MIEIYINWMDRWTQKITLVHVGSLVTILVCTKYNCIYCGQFMTTREANKIHIQQECLERPDAALPCACLFCGLRFPSKASLRVHLSRWCKEKWFSLFFWCFLLMKYMTLYWYSAAVQHLFLGAISNFATGFQKVNVSQNKMSKGCLYIPIY